MTDQPAIEAKPVEYDGVTLRSRLELQWVFTLDALNISWEYEPRTITLPSGVRYLPDFWLPQLGTWLEVKGAGVPRIEKAIELAASRACRCSGDCTCEWPRGELVLIGHPPRPFDPNEWRDTTHEPPPAAQRQEWFRDGHPMWSTAHGPGAWLARCLSCHQAGWFVRRAPLCCRACGARLDGGHVHAPGTRDIRFGSLAEIPLKPLKDFRDDGGHE